MSDILDATRKYFADHEPDWDTHLLIVGLAAEVEIMRRQIALEVSYPCGQTNGGTVDHDELRAALDGATS